MILAHLLYDFHWQGEFISNNKGKKIFLLFVHALTWSMFVGIPFMLCKNWIAFLFLFVSHFFTDMWKSKQEKNDENFYKIYIDQGIHFVTIFIAWLILS